MFAAAINISYMEDNVEYHLTEDKPSQLLQAMVDAGPELLPILKNQENDYIAYLDLPELIAKTKPVLSKHGLVMISGVEPHMQADGQPAKLVAQVRLYCAASGEYIVCGGELGAADIPKANSIQKLFGSGTYMRRNMELALLNLAGASDDTDGGEREDDESGEADGKAQPPAKERTRDEEEHEERRMLIAQIGTLMKNDLISEKTRKDVRLQIAKTKTEALPKLIEDCEAMLRKAIATASENDAPGEGQEELI